MRHYSTLVYLYNIAHEINYYLLSWILIWKFSTYTCKQAIQIHSKDISICNSMHTFYLEQLLSKCQVVAFTIESLNQNSNTCPVYLTSWSNKPRKWKNNLLDILVLHPAYKFFLPKFDSIWYFFNKYTIHITYELTI